MEVVRIAPGKLKPWDKNPRKNDPAVEAVAKSIRDFGFNVPILCDRDHTIIAGHTRWKAAKNRCTMRGIPFFKSWQFFP